VQGGRVEVRYRPKDGRFYEARAQNVEVIDASPLPDDTCGPAEAAKRDAPVKRAAPKAASPGPSSSGPRADAPAPEVPAGAIIAYTDGACSGNPGPAGLGVVVIDGDRRVEISEYLGVGTNNIAELTALERAMEEVADPTRPIVLHTDSQYAIGVLQKGWKAKANTTLIERLRAALAARSGRARIVYVPGHAGVPLNERADALAREAIQRRTTKRVATSPTREAK
jgi:ribonuclease HI